MENLRMELKKMKELYEDKRDDLDDLESNGDLSKLINLRDTFDETFDQFFDDETIRKKYDSWNYDEDCIDFTKCNADIEALLDDEDLQKLINFYQNYIWSMEEDISNILEDREERKKEFEAMND